MEEDESDRVKIYQMDDSEQWIDQGTGRISVQERSIIVMSEIEPLTMLMKSTIKNIEYSRQQDTLIIWNEQDQDLALSFQVESKCDEIWNYIVEIQKQFLDLMEDLPLPTVDNLDLIEKLFLLGKGHRDLFLRRILQSSFLSDLLNCYKSIMDSFQNGISIEDIDTDPEGTLKLNEMQLKCSQLSTIFKGLFYLNSELVLKNLFSIEFPLVLEILEYDQQYKNSKFREIFESKKLKQVIEITDQVLLTMMLDLQKAMFLKDVVLARSLEDSTFAFLTTFIQKNQALIVNYFISHKQLLSDILMTPLDCTQSQKIADGLQMINEICQFAKTCEKDDQLKLFNILVSLDIFKNIHTTAAPFMLNTKPEPRKSIFSEQDLKFLNTSSISLLRTILEYSTDLYRQYLIKEDNIQEFTQIYTSTQDESFQFQFFDILKLLLSSTASVTKLIVKS